MSLHGFKMFVIQVLDIESESEWLHSEKVNIFITAIIPTFIAFLTALVTIIDKCKMEAAWHIMKSSIFINSMQLVIIVCTIVVIFRIRRKILITKAKRLRLTSYIKEKCNLRDQSEENVNYTLDVTGKILKQFYYAWIALWTIFFIYYSGSLCFAILKSVDFNCYSKGLQILIENGYNNLFNYLSSTAMFVLFIILNSTTVSLHERKTGRGLISAVLFIVFFGCTILLPTLFSFSLCWMSYFKMQLLISIILGIYSAFSFVLVLGKLNSDLQIPRYIFYWLYMYALMQTFQFLFTFISINKLYCWGTFYDFPHYLEVFEMTFQYITLIGKVSLSLTLLWIAYDSKIIHFVIEQSQAITELTYRKDVFRTYMKDAD